MIRNESFWILFRNRQVCFYIKDKQDVDLLVEKVNYEDLRWNDLKSFGSYRSIVDSGGIYINFGFNGFQYGSNQPKSIALSVNGFIKLYSSNVKFDNIDKLKLFIEKHPQDDLIYEESDDVKKYTFV